MKRVRAELVYPGTDVEQLFALLHDAAFREAVLDYQGVLRRQATVEGSRVLLDYAHGVDRVPSFAKKFVGEEIPIRQEEDWQGAAAEVRVTIPGKPGEMTGTRRLEQRGEDAVEVADMAVKVSIPLVGGKIEELIAGLLNRAMHAENKVGVKWLAGEWR